MAVNVVSKWTYNNGFSFFVTITICVHFCSQRWLHPDPEIFYTGVLIQAVDKIKILCPHFGKKLAFWYHIAQLHIFKVFPHHKVWKNFKYFKDLIIYFIGLYMIVKDIVCINSIQNGLQVWGVWLYKAVCIAYLRCWPLLFSAFVLRSFLDFAHSQSLYRLWWTFSGLKMTVDISEMLLPYHFPATSSTLYF